MPCTGSPLAFMTVTILLMAHSLGNLLWPPLAIARQQTEKSRTDSSTVTSSIGRPVQSPLSLDEIRQAIRQNPKDANLYYRAGQLEEKRENWSQALKDYQTAIKLNSKFADAHYRTGIAWEQTGEMYYEGRRVVGGPQRSKAIDAYKTAIRLRPDFAEAYYRLSLAYLMGNNLRKANEAYQQLSQLEPDTDRTRQLLRQIYHHHQEQAQKR